MEKNNYSKNDCFLMKGSDNNDPMTVYQITDIDETHTYAKSLSITTQMVHGWPISQEYDKNIPENAIPLPLNSWQWARKQMSSFVKETISYLYDNIIDGKINRLRKFEIIAEEILNNLINNYSIKKFNEYQKQRKNMN